MAGLRELKKENTRRAILEYSEKVFKEKGYSSVKTAEIAKAVGVGEGTVFNYFGSKDNLFLEAVFGSFQNEKYKTNIKEGTSNASLINEIINVIDFYLKKIADTEKNLLKEYFSIVFSNKKESISPMFSLMNMDKMIMEELEKLFDTLKENGSLVEGFDSSVASTCVYSCVIVQFTVFVYSDESEYTNVIKDLKKQILFIIKGWC